MSTRDAQAAYAIWRFYRWLQGGETYNSIDAKVAAGDMKPGDMKPGICKACGQSCVVHPLYNRSNCCDAEHE